MKPPQSTATKPQQRSAMKSSHQWIAVLMLALMVGGISFVTVYLGDRGSTETPPPAADAAQLTFPFKTFPREGEKVQTTEVRQVGHQDYWFVNDSGEELPVGLNAKGCTCTEVEVTVASQQWMPYLVRSSVTQALQQPMRGLDNLTCLAAANYGEHLFPELPEFETPAQLTKEFSTIIPNGAVGRVRLTWHQDQVKPLVTYAELWMGQRGGVASARLEAGVRICTPLEVTKDVKIDAVNERDLENTNSGQRGRGWIVCFSMTRPNFRIKARMLNDRNKPESDPIEVGEPTPLEDKDLRRLEEKTEGMHRLVALSGYRIPVRVRAKAKDGTPMEWGHFQRAIQLSSDDPGIEPTMVQVTGEIVGDISVGAGDEAGVINLGPFFRSRGKRHAINLETDEKGLDLELDTTHKPSFLNVTLSEPRESASGHRSWVLKVEVPPNAASGEFPSFNNPDYRDSAIYVKTKGGKSGKSLRSIRIPVHGVANKG